MVSNEKKKSRRTKRELDTVETMIGMYCNARHGTSSKLCDDCSALVRYVQQRVEQCPFGQDKPTCLNCAVHCYKKTMREKIRKVMRYSGPRMALRHPVFTIFHFIDGRRPTPQTRSEPPHKNNDGE